MLESLSPDELQFIKAIEKYKFESNKHFLSWTEVLKVVKGLGYRISARKDTGTTGVRRRSGTRKRRSQRVT